MKTFLAALAVAAVVSGVSLSSPAARAFEAPGAASSQPETHEIGARKRVAKRHRGTGLRVSRLSRRATEPPNPDRPYYRPAPAFFPFATDRGYF